MAKLKVQYSFIARRVVAEPLQTSDWGSMSRTCSLLPLDIGPDCATENLAVHRARILESILPSAVAYGVAEVEPIREPLKVCVSLRVVCIVV
jgi:hypothetical protein